MFSPKEKLIKHFAISKHNASIFIILS